MARRVLAQARADIRAITDYIFKRNPHAALRWSDAVEARIDRIARMPGKGAPRFDVAPGLRIVPHGRYLILHREDGRDVEIVRVVHAARDWEGLV